MQPEARQITGGEEAIDPATPHGALSEFYRAFNGRDLDLMRANWLEGGEPIMDNPVGHIRRGWDAIQPTYETLFGGAGKRVSVEFIDYTIHDLGNGFVAIGRERGKLTGDGIDLDLAIRTTRLFVKRNGRFRQFHHHGSIDDPDLLSRFRAAFA